MIIELQARRHRHRQQCQTLIPITPVYLTRKIEMISLFVFVFPYFSKSEQPDELDVFGNATSASGKLPIRKTNLY